MEMYSKKDFAFGFVDENKEVMIISIPLKRCVEDALDGAALLRGKLDEMKQIALLELQQMRQKKANGGILIPKAVSETLKKPDLQLA